MSFFYGDNSSTLKGLIEVKKMIDQANKFFQKTIERKAANFQFLKILFL